MGWLGDSYLSVGVFLRFSICDCKERILVAGWCTDLVRGTKTAKKGGGNRERSHVRIRNCEINMAKKRVQNKPMSTMQCALYG